MINAFIFALIARNGAVLPALHVEGKNFVDPAGHVVLLKGCNVGNWLVNEFWMMGIGGKPGVPADQYSLEQTLTTRFGASEDLRLMNLLRSSWMTERDWKNIQTYNFNLVRVPFNYRLLEDDERPMQLRPDAWKWLDIAVDEAEKHGLYVILDLHGVQGGQTMNDHTGRSGQNKLWTVAANQDRMSWLWTKIAARYRNRSAVIAYDPMNEPYGGTKPQVLSVFEKTYAAIRTVDPDKLIFAHGATDNFDHFGDPKTHGWKNVGFQMHFYPGLFGDPPTIKSSIRHLSGLTRFAKKIDQFQVPFLVGEMNVVLNSNGGAPMMRRYFDAHAKNGWMTTIWSYKVVTAEGGTNGGSWGLFTNSGPAREVNFETGSESEIESYFASFATQPLMPYEELREDLTAVDPKLPPLQAGAIPRTKAPSDEVIPGWTSSDIGGALPGGLVKRGAEFELYGGGDDIWGSSDQFRFLNRKVSGDFDLSVVIEGVEDTSGYTKAGIMVRQSLDANSATALLSCFPSGDVQIGVREQADGSMSGSDGPKSVLPNAQIGVSRHGTTLTFTVNGNVVRRVELPSLADSVFVGPIALSHSGGELTKVTYRDLMLSGGRTSQLDR